MRPWPSRYVWTIVGTAFGCSIASILGLSLGVFDVDGERNVEFVSSAHADDSSRIDDEMPRDIERISIATVSRFHDMVVSKCLAELPGDLNLQNCGPIGTYTYARGQRLEGDPAWNCLTWQVNNDLGVFGFKVSLRKTAASVVDLQLDAHRLFVSVDSIQNGKDLDDRLPDLGGLSIRQVLNRLKQ